MTNRLKFTSLKWPALLPALFWLPGCDVSLGPKTHDEIIFIRHQGIAARVAHSTQAELVVEKDGATYRQVMDIGGFYVISPDLKDEKK